MDLVKLFDSCLMRIRVIYFPIGIRVRITFEFPIIWAVT